MLVIFGHLKLWVAVASHNFQVAENSNYLIQQDKC